MHVMSCVKMASLAIAHTLLGIVSVLYAYVSTQLHLTSTLVMLNMNPTIVSAGNLLSQGLVVPSGWVGNC